MQYNNNKLSKVIIFSLTFAVLLFCGLRIAHSVAPKPIPIQQNALEQVKGNALKKAIENVDQTQTDDAEKPADPQQAQTNNQETTAAEEKPTETKAVGNVLIVQGKFTAIDKDEKERNLERRSKFFIGDTLVTAKDSRAQIRFLDDTLIALRPETEFRIDEYAYEKKPTDKSKTFLLKGGFRAITGLIAKKTPKNVSTGTPVAVIGVRGTEYTALLALKELFVSVWKGSVDIANDVADLVIGEEETYKNAMVRLDSEKPIGLADVPPQISFCPYETKKKDKTAPKKKKR